MDSFRTFMNIFTRGVRERNASDLTEILEDSKTYFERLSKDDRELALSIFFDKQEGILCFLENEFNTLKPDKNFDTVIKNAFRLLEFVIEQFSEIFLPYIVDTKNICQKVLETKCSLLIKKPACNAFIKLIELFKEHEMELGKTIEKLVSLFAMVDIKERSIWFSVIAKIIRHRPDLLEIHENATAIFRQLRNDFIKQNNPRNTVRSTDIFQIYFDVFSDLLREFSEDLEREHYEELYSWVKEFSRPERYQVKKIAMRSAVNLLSRHIYLFREFVYADYDHWYKLLINLAQDKNTQCSECGQRALRNFYRSIGEMLKKKTSEEDKTVFLYFKNFFEKQLEDNQEVIANIRFVVYGFSQMAAPCKRYLTHNDVREMFSLVAHCAMPLCSRENLGQLDLDSICDYLEALSEIILHMSELSIDQINIISKLSIILIKRFPELPIVNRNFAIHSLTKTIVNIRTVSKALLEEFLYNLIYNGIIWTCSHTLLVDAELERELKRLDELLMCYKNYLPLWSQLLKREWYKPHEYIVQDVVDSAIHVCITLITKLNLNTRVNDDNIFSDASFSQIAENAADFRMFVNIVDLYVDIINKLESSLLTRTLHRFLLKFIDMSYKRPLVSGFYKLVYATFKHIPSLTEDESETETLELLYKYLINILNLMPTFTGELLTTCLSLILNVPEMYIERILDSSIPTFKIALTVGLSDFEVAWTALNALERWSSCSNDQQKSKFLLEIVPFLEPYLNSGESYVEMSQDIIKSERKVIKRIVLRDNEKTLEKFQMRVLLFIASLDTDALMSFVYKKSMDIGATWDKKDLLKYSLSLSDAEVDIYFDKILPRLTELARNSGDRRTKIIACEVLHSMVMLILGKTSKSNLDKFAPLYNIICPALLSLGCDFDEAARQIFQPLMLQLMHWLSSKFMLKSLATTCFIDSVFEALSNDSNSSLREFSGACLAEFTKWSIKQSNNDRRGTESNIDEVVNKMMNFAVHPSTCKRIAAATAFNHLYAILREDETIVSVYWLELLYCFVKSLDGCNDPTIVVALNHVERVLIAKKNLLNANHGKRRLPTEFKGATLTDAAYWLLTQCGSVNSTCRAKCMDLVVKLSEHINDCDSVATMIDHFIAVYGNKQFNRIIFNDLDSKTEDLITCSIILPLLRSLDCYIWLIKNDLLKMEYLFANSSAETEILFNSAKNFIFVVNKMKRETGDDSAVMLSKELDELQNLQCKLIVTIFDFFRILLDSDENYVPDYFLCKDLFELISKCIMCPQVVGFETINLESTESLSLILHDLMESMIRKGDHAILDAIKRQLSVHVEKHINNFIDLDKIVSSSCSCSELKQYVHGLRFLERHNILGQMYNGIYSIDQPDDKITRVFGVLAREEIGEFVSVNIKTPVIEYLQILMELLLSRYETSITKTLVALIGNDTMVWDLFVPEDRLGMYFLRLFKNEIFKYMLKDAEKTMEAFDSLLQTNSSLLLTMMEQLFLFVQRHRNELRENRESLADAMIKRFTVFERAVNDQHDRKEKLISIYGVVVSLKERPIEVQSLNKDFHAWILDQLTGNDDDVNDKIRILQNFLVCLTDKTSDSQPELLAILHTLRTDRIALCPNNFSLRDVKASKAINCFQTLLTLLPVTKSIVVFKSIILFAAGIAEHLWDDRTEENLKRYFISIGPANALASMEAAYKLFLSLNKPINERFDILRRFLLPSFEFCETAEIKKFFERNIREIYTVIERAIVGSSSDMSQLIVSKIGCYDLVAVMFAKVDINEIDDPDSVITRNAIDQVETGKELLRNLYRSTLQVRMLKTPDPEQKETMRLLHCSAYNLSIAIVSLKTDEDTYKSIFAENRKKEQLIWENIVDCQKRYDIEQTFKEYPKHYKKLVNIRKSIRKQTNSGRNSYVYSYDLSNCTLNEDIHAYDYNEAVVRDNNTDTKQESMSVLLESDQLNNHECMATICGVLNHMISTQISTPPDDNTDQDDIVIPKWLECFCSPAGSDNVRLFKLKIMLNMQTVFKPYAKYCLQVIIHTAYSYLVRNPLNYVIADVIEMLIDWRRVALPDTPKEKAIVQKLWEIMIETAVVNKTNDITGAVYKYNLYMIKVILEMWRDCLELPQNLGSKMETAAGATVYLILICMVNGMIDKMIEREDIFKFLEKSLQNWKDDKQTVVQCCECFGLILKHLNEHDSLSSRIGLIIEQIRSVLRQMQASFAARQIICIRALCKSYPDAGIIYFDFVTTNMIRVDRMEQSYCLEIFLHCIPKFNTEQVLKELEYLKFRDLLKNKVLLYEKIALQIIHALVSILPPSYLLSLVVLVTPYTKHDSSEYRDCAYDIFIGVYNKYIVDTSDEEDARKLMHISKEMLFDGILDPAEQLQEKILDFWTRSAHLTSTREQRLLESLNAYVPGASGNFLPYLLLMILDLAKKSKNYMQKIFDEPLYEDCNYRDYKITPSWRTKNLGSKAPLFVPSLASKMNQTFTQMTATLTGSFESSYTRPYESNTGFDLQATQDLEFEPTFADQEPTSMSDNYDFDDTFKMPAVPEPAHNKKSKRMLSSSAEISSAIRQKEIKKNIQRAEMIKEDAVRQRSSVKLYRKYRIGDFPDIEIFHSTLIEPLQQLAKKDSQICKDLTVSIVCAFLKECRENEFVKNVADSLKLIVEKERGSNAMIAVSLEILQATRVVNCSPEVVARVSRLNSLNFLGPLVIEENIIYRRNDIEPPKKRARNYDVQDTTMQHCLQEEWLQLANLYESINDVDVVLSIFHNHITNEDIRDASFAQTANNWVEAKAAYEKAYETDSVLVKEHCLQGLFECLSNMCRWDKIDEHIQKKSNESIENIWDDPWKDWMLPWLFEVYVRRLIDAKASNSLFETKELIEAWLGNDAKVKYIKRSFGSELTMFWLYDQLEVARDLTLSTLDEMREQWIRLHPLSTQLRVHMLQRLRIINDVNWYIKVLKTAERPDDLRDILNFWNNSLPSVQDAIIPWEKLTSYRIEFISGPLRKTMAKWNIDETQQDSESVPDRVEAGIARQLSTAAFSMRLKMIETALAQKNKYIAKKYLIQLEKIINISDHSVDMEHQFLLAVAKTKYLNGEIETDTKKKLSNYASSWTHCHDLLRRADLDPMINVHIRHQIGKVASKLAQLSQKDATFSDLLAGNTAILDRINVANDDAPAIRESLNAYCLNQLKECCAVESPSIRECYYTLSKYCYEKLSGDSYAGDAEISKEFVRSTLKAMSYGSLEAAHYFPCLLKSEYFEDEQTKDIFLKDCEGIQTWLFLSWQAQLFSHLGTAIAPLIIPILKRIVETYPNAVMYTFRLTVETNPALLNEARTYEIRQILYQRSEIDHFLLAMQYLVQPELYLQYYLFELLKNLSLGSATAVSMLLKKVYPNKREMEQDLRPGTIFNEIKAYENQIKRWESWKPEKIKQEVSKLIEKLKNSFGRRKDKSHLQDYSPWLHRFSGKDIEIPGQYTGDRKPMPRYHAKIIKIEPSVKVLKSLRKPIQIVMIGNDAKEYNFLVKFGEDLRQDQRLQQLFTVMNKTLRIDTACKQKQLSIDTYQVIPLSKTVGLIQWIDNTRSLQEFIRFTFSKEQEKRCESIGEQYEQWIQSAAPSKKQVERYKEATVKYSVAKVNAKMGELIRKTDWDSLRKTFTVLCPSVESFVVMRRNFVTTYATMCIAHWILGIGDRHLGNLLIVVASGRCLGIDFGLAFDAGVDLRIPELMPFRLTHQILGLLRPFTEKDLLRAIMVHTLRALRNESGPILSCMDVFVHEPLNWTEHVNKKQQENEDDVADIKWMPKKKIKAVTKKLTGIKPSSIILEQLKEQHEGKYLDRCYVILNGEDDIKRPRASIKNDSLSPEEQIDCLLDQATDLNILGRTYGGWRPWL
ncbi:DNA-dependent protein kinase catalytic subunit isoform X2 [Lasioglossum baleicum]|uniref:DNA-dependent protein kinase catalytic subunit isoform X2 n=1 Tax=Lasioglossum baleicum TaxID=434251 RepID=UPI003FCEDA4D